VDYLADIKIKNILKIITYLIFVNCILAKISFDNILSDTVEVSINIYSDKKTNDSNIKVIDHRTYKDRVLCISETKKFFIPVDLYVILDKPVSQYLEKYISIYCPDKKGTLYLNDLNIEYENQTFLSKGFLLNAYTLLTDEQGKLISSWTWEIKLKAPQKEKKPEYYSQLLDKFFTNQAKYIAEEKYSPNTYPYLYKRNLYLWTEFLVFPKSFCIIPRMMLYYPEGMNKKFARATRYIYYKKSNIHESIGINGLNYFSYTRIDQNFLRVCNVNINFGINNFNPKKIKHTEYFNILMFNILTGYSFEYNRYHRKGFIAGCGLYLQINILPTEIDKIEPGLSFYIGYKIP